MIWNQTFTNTVSYRKCCSYLSIKYLYSQYLQFALFAVTNIKHITKSSGHSDYGMTFVYYVLRLVLYYAGVKNRCTDCYLFYWSIHKYIHDSFNTIHQLMRKNVNKAMQVHISFKFPYLIKVHFQPLTKILYKFYSIKSNFQ